MSSPTLTDAGAQHLMLSETEAEQARIRATDLASWDLSPTQLCDLELLLTGALAPLTGYLSREDHDQVLASSALADGTSFPWPLSLEVSESFAADCTPGSEIALRDPEGLLIALIQVSDCWEVAPREIESTLGAGGGWPAGSGRPRPEWLHSDRGWRLGGRVLGVDPPFHYDFGTLRGTPLELRQRMHRQGWQRTLAVMTARPIGPGEHALIAERARQLEANLLLLPESGTPEPGDPGYYARLRAIEAILPRFSEMTTELLLLPIPCAAGGSRDIALRQRIAANFGATDLLLLDADEDPSPHFEPATPAAPVLGGSVVWLPSHDRHAIEDAQEATEPGWPCGIEETLQRMPMGESIPAWLAWPEQVEQLMLAWPPRARQGFTLFLTGLSGSGKSTIARALLARLMEEGSRRVTLLDGDIVRKNLSSELGFSREHRDLNILRIGYVASEITKNGGIAICAPIAPYATTRASVRQMIEAVGGFVEIHVATPLEVCEARDRKGLYAKARAGLIKEFTGISDPYETPENPEMALDTQDQSPDEAAQQVLLKLRALGYL